MSHMIGAVHFKDGYTLMCEYNGTVDLMQSRLGSAKEIEDNWRSEKESWSDCTCGQDEPVRISTLYGSGHS